MRGRRFVVNTLLLAAAASAVIVAVDWRINFFGVFEPDRSAPRTVVGFEQETKYLFSFNYIPANFNALLLGSSIASNIDTARIHGLRMYNAAVSGANITEEKLIADNVLRRGHIKCVVFFLNPYLLATHGRKAGGMRPDDKWEALGSTDLFSAYLGALAVRGGLARERFTAGGMQDIREFQRRWNPGGPVDPGPFALDRTALTQLAQLVALARARGAEVVWVFAPVYRGFYDRQRLAYRAFEERIRAFVRAGDPVIDFNARAYASLTGSSGSFLDGVHMSRRAASEVADVLDRLLASRRAWPERDRGSSPAAGSVVDGSR